MRVKNNRNEEDSIPARLLVFFFFFFLGGGGGGGPGVCCCFGWPFWFKSVFLCDLYYLHFISLTLPLLLLGYEEFGSEERMYLFHHVQHKMSCYCPCQYDFTTFFFPSP